MAETIADVRKLGFCPTRLARIDAFFQSEVDRSRIPGAVVRVMRAGHLAFHRAFGFVDREAGQAMPDDAIFRIASMTKPIVSVVTLMLAEEGLLDLSMPVGDILPEMRPWQVRDGDGNTRAPAREPIVHDLLRHTSGLTYGSSGDSIVHRAYRDADLMSYAQSNAEMAAKLGRIPLLCEPGSTFEYGMSTDLLGHVLERLCGRDLDHLIRSRIAEPLDMTATSFLLPPARRERLAEPQVDPATGRRPDLRFKADEVPRWFSGGGGLLSTAADYGRFAQMLLNRGALGDVRLLGPKSLDLMVSDALPPGVRFGPQAATLGVTAPLPEMGQSFGLGLAIRREPGRNPCPGSIGDFHWAGVSGTYFWVDPAEELIAILMTQAPSERVRHRAALRNLVYQAVIGPASTV